MAAARDLEYLRPYCATDRQEQYLDAMIASGGKLRPAARALGINHQPLLRAMSALKKRATMAGQGDYFQSPQAIPNPLTLKGTTTLYKDGVQQLQWVKAKAGDVDWSEAFNQAMESLQDGIKPAPVLPGPDAAQDMLAVIPMGDPHFGAYSWAGDTGESYNLDIARALHVSGVRELLRAMGPVKRLVLLNLGDMFDSNCSKNRTPRSGNIMDPSGTFNEILEAAVHSMMEIIELCLEKAETVEVPTIEGNHDPEACAALSAFIYGRYGNHPRVVCRLKPYVYWYLRWRKNLIGSHHGHGAKPDALPGVMAVDRRADWGMVEHCTWLIGHYHHKQKIGQEKTGATVEGFNTLAANNKHHHDEGYRGARSITSILYHPEFGEWSRIVRNVASIHAACPDMLEAGSSVRIGTGQNQDGKRD